MRAGTTRMASARRDDSRDSRSEARTARDPNAVVAVVAVAHLVDRDAHV